MRALLLCLPLIATTAALGGPDDTGDSATWATSAEAGHRAAGLMVGALSVRQPTAAPNPVAAPSERPAAATAAARWTTSSVNGASARTVTWTGLQPGARVILFGSERGTASPDCPMALGTPCSGLVSPFVVASGSADAAGRITLHLPATGVPWIEQWTRTGDHVRNHGLL